MNNKKKRDKRLIDVYSSLLAIRFPNKQFSGKNNDETYN